MITLLFLLVTTTTINDAADQNKTTGQQKACGSDWEEFGGSCYKAVTFLGVGNETFANQTESSKRCESEGAKLASVHNEAENQFIKRLIYGSYEQCQEAGQYWWCIDWYIYDGYWLGMTLSRDARSGQIVTANWTDATPMDYGSPVVVNNGTAGNDTTGYGKQQGPWYAPEQRPTYYLNYNCVYALMTNRGIGWADYPCDAATIGGYVCKKSK